MENNPNQPLVYLENKQGRCLLETSNLKVRYPGDEQYTEDLGGEYFYVPKGYYPLLISEDFIKSQVFDKAQIDLEEDSNSTTENVKRQTKAPRPPNAFILYRRDKHKQISQENKTVSNKNLSKIIGEMWKKEDYEVKQRYLMLSEQEKNAHKVKYPGYKYKPRQDIKRRAKPSANKNLITENQELFDAFDSNLNSLFKK